VWRGKDGGMGPWQRAPRDGSGRDGKDRKGEWGGRRGGKWGGKDGKGGGRDGRRGPPICEKCPAGTVAMMAPPKPWGSPMPGGAPQQPPIERGGPGGRRGGPPGADDRGGRRGGKRGRLALCVPCPDGKKANADQTQCV
jgi:hypothetical protein